MIKDIALFEIRNGFKRLSNYIYFALFFAFGFLIFMVAAGVFPGVDMGLGAGGKLYANSHFMLFVVVSSTSYYGLLVVAAVMGNAAHQDFRHNTFPLVFTAPISKWQYLGGRFLAANVVLLFIFSSIGLACVVAGFTASVDDSLIGPTHLYAYVAPYLIAVIPNTLFIGAIFFAMAALTRNMLPVYVSAVVLFVGYLIAAVLSSQLDSKYIAGVIDPFGNFALEHVTQYWTVAEKNSLAIPMTGLMLINRLIWTGIGLAVFATTCFVFRMRQGGEDRRRPRGAVAGGTAPRQVELPVTPVRVTSQAAFLPKLIAMEFSRIVFSVPFLLIVLCGVGFVFVSAITMQSLYGTSIYPVTAVVSEIARGSFTLFMMIIIIVYSGQLVWREREAGMGQLFDVQPISTWLPFVSKTVALILVQAFLLVVVMLTGMAYQTANGYYNYEIGIYLKDLFGIQLINLALMSMLAMLIQVIVNHKYIGHFVMVLFLLSNIFFSNMGWDHHLYRYGSTPGYMYSDMNGFGHFLLGVRWFQTYWVLFALLLAVVCKLYWVRGLETSIDARTVEARSRFNVATTVFALVTLICLVSVGGQIVYNTNVLNDYSNRHNRRSLSARYERDYKAHESLPQPRITAVKVDVDIYPADRRIVAKGHYDLRNKSDGPIESVFVNFLNRDMEIRELELTTDHTLATDDDELQVYVYEFDEPLQPGASTRLDFDLDFFVEGFKNSRGDTSIVYNGTFFNFQNLPQIGYISGRELSNDAVRKKRGFKSKSRMASIDDLQAREDNYIVRHADWIDFETTISTSSDQIAVAPGSLRREWSEGDRRYFHYQADDPIICFFSFLSARYEVVRDDWNGVAIEVYHHPAHTYNIESMVEVMKSSLAYCSENFSPYQHKQARILEFPRYMSFAQSFPNTIPYSEAIGFIAKVDPDDDDDIDYPVYVTAHEIAHQWWAHQVIGGNVQGATMLSETLAQYSALMVMKETFGPKQMKRFLRHELNQYLVGRGGERKKELPLALVENQQYIHYNKGSLVMYALQDYIGEKNVNKALAAFIEKVGFQEPPYTTSRALIEEFRKVTPDDLQYLIDDLFESITLFDNKAVSASYRKIGGGKYEVTIDVTSRKVHADAQGAETDAELNDQIDIGVLGPQGQYLFLEKRLVDSAESQFVVTVSSKPDKAGIDPLNILIDRLPSDNVTKVKLAAE